MTLPSWSTRLIDRLDAADVRASSAGGQLSERQLNWRTRPGAWSVGQCLDHLIVTNRVYLPAMAAALAKAEPGLAPEIEIGWFGRWFIRNYAEPVTERTRARAPGKIEPSPEVDGAIVPRFLASNGEAKAFIRRCADYDVNRLRFRNPFVPLIRFTVGTGLEILVRHQGRHLAQAEEVRRQIPFR